MAGYTSYIELVEELIRGKEIIQNGMRQEVDRCRMAVESAAAGNIVSLVSGGDAGVYGMAGLVLEIVEKEGYADLVEVVIVPGITSSTASAAILGAPLMHDFVTISLSDWLTELPLIEKRLHCAGEGDFVVVIYNPKSKARPDFLKRAQEILLQYKAPESPVGIVRNAYRDEQSSIITTLGELHTAYVDMRTTVVVGDSMTYVKDGKMITPRGYKL